MKGIRADSAIEESIPGMMISDIEQRQIDQIQYEDDPEKIIGIARNSSNPFFLQQYALSYNWGDGYDLPLTIANNKSCDLGTALTLFWLAEGMSYYQDEVERNEYNEAWVDFCDLLIGRLLNNAYLPGPVSFKPEINKVTAFKYKKAAVPDVLYQGINGVSGD